MNSPRPRFSVLMANYNNEKYVAEAITSIADQVFADWELIIVDDASTDNSVVQITPFLKDERIKLIKNISNIGYAAALNILLRESSAEYIGVLDSDDALSKNALEIMYEAHKKNLDCGFIHSQFIFCDENLKEKKLGFCQAIPPGKSNLNGYYSSAFRTFKKVILQKVGGFDDRIIFAEDRDIIFKMEEVTKIMFVNFPLYYYRVLSNSQSNGPNNRHISRASHSLAKYHAYLRRQGTAIPNLTPSQMADELLEGLVRSIYAKDGKKAWFFLKTSLGLNPFNFKGFVVAFKRLIQENNFYLSIFKNIK